MKFACSSSGQNGSCVWSMKRMHTHTYPWIHSLQTFRAVVDLEHLISEMDAHPACPVELLLWIGRGHTGKAKPIFWGTPQPSPGDIPIGATLASIHTPHRQGHLRAYSSFQEGIHLFQPGIFPFHHTIPSGGDSPSSREVPPLSGCLILADPRDRAAGVPCVVPQPWSTQHSCWWLGDSCTMCPAHHCWPEQSLPEPDSGHAFLPSLLLDK